MTDLIYDGSFEGFLCAIVRSQALPGDTRIFSVEERAQDLFSTELIVATQRSVAAGLRKRFLAVAGSEESETLLFVHSSRDPRRHELLRAYIALTLHERRSVAGMCGMPLVMAVAKIRGRVSWEIGKLLGFTRFRKVGGHLWYAQASPDANIIGFLGPHFSDRFPDEGFLIHDVGRKLGYAGIAGTGGIVDVRGMPPGVRAGLADCEQIVESQWEAYFRAVAVPERINPELQARNMPRRYWRYLVEKPGLS
jgi:probable DNA metabolism protein